VGNSTKTLQSVIDIVSAKATASPLSQPSGYGTALALELANDVMADIIAERFNWKWNSQVAAPFYTNSYQQDYPQIGLANVDWGEDCDRVDINNTSIPKPLCNITFVKQLSRTNWTSGPVGKICWMYNSDMGYGNWAGANQVYSPLLGTNPTAQNGAMAFIDVNGNILVLTTFGTTGSTQPAAAASSPEGTTVNDGSCVWTVAAPTSQGWRVFPLPGATGPVWQMTPKYQVIAPQFIKLQQLINPIPDNYSKYFRRGYEIACKGASANPKDKQEANALYPLWQKDLLDAAKQGDKEVNAYGLFPATYPVDTVYPWLRNPQDPAEPY
jgi:hypothetical protein